MSRMPGDDVPPGTHPVTQSELVRDLTALGIGPGILMLHTRMSALGWVVGGAETVVRALLEALGPDGTLVAYTGWDDNPYALETWPSDWKEAYLRELPPYDPAISQPARDNGRIPERIWNWPGSARSAHPEANVTAIGRQASWLVSDQPNDFPQGPGSPLAKLVEAAGQVLMLGAPLSTITLLHHAETLADGRGKRFVTYRMPVVVDGRAEWRTYRDIDTTARGAFPYEDFLSEDAFEVIGREALAGGCGRSGLVAGAVSHLFDGRDLTRFAIQWIEEHLGGAKGRGLVGPG
jgi:aminoglycoside 3-N-acetyltransferase